MESQVKDIYGLLQHPSSHGIESSQSSSQATALDPNSGRGQNPLRNGAGGSQLPSPSNDSSSFPRVLSVESNANAAPRNVVIVTKKPTRSRATTELPPNILDELLDFYNRMIHQQPLPLFRTADLSDYLGSSPRHLLDSFLALTLSFKAHVDGETNQSNAIEHYVRSAEDTVKKLACQGVPRLDVVQSLCLLALRDVIVCKPTQAQMTVGMASRLEACRNSLEDSLSDSTDADLSIRCRWSVYILEKILSPSLCAHTGQDLPLHASSFPTSAPVPPVLPSTRKEDYPSDLYNPYSADVDHGIVAYSIKMVSVWGDVAAWLHHVRLGRDEVPSSPDSRYARLVAMVHDRDAQLPARHLMMNVAFTKRSRAEVLERREYWVPWVLMQVLCHVYLALLNHPFIHLVAVRSCCSSRRGGGGGGGGYQTSGLFLQRTIDAALFHSGWVFWLLGICEEHRLDVYNPFLGQLVAAVATIPWLLQFVQDKKVSTKAARDLDWCKTYLTRVSKAWLHLSQKANKTCFPSVTSSSLVELELRVPLLEILQSLQLVAEHRRQESTENGGAIAFPPWLFWELLDPDVYQATSVRPSSSSQARIPVTTHLTHPLGSSQAEEPHEPSAAPSPNFADSFLIDPGDLEQVYVEDLLSHFMVDNSFG
ncbi:hypothetical protein CkaCkLH20_05167 [Colletotrichum karsti]|uniref:Transcription factor domain-containing protein n=1 Tax=Colletotrichum karsti TaxID=1095194 RepID=A0A9P6I5V1_9PEZI|nr:uncharacterized protein CkaCkLH20_05167 [Colletotrichum karsti]KAF9877467.1 hypothetical protein CkaCkLH20_05167 [Colletotrichum karsti]